MLYLTQHELDEDMRRGVLIAPISSFRLCVKEGGTIAWRCLNGELRDSGEFRFVIDQNDEIYASDKHDESETGSPTYPHRPPFHHASLVGDAWPKYAGRGTAGKGFIVFMNNHTGHFCQPKSTFDRVFPIFEKAGADVSRAKAAWYEGKLYSPSNPDKVMTRVAPLCNHPEGKFFGIYNDANVPRSDLSPRQYRARIYGG
jgi:hypothetical protein